MNYRLASVLAEESITNAGTKVIDLDMTDIISRIQINLEIEGDGTVGTDHLAACISNIELVDGSDVLFSLSGKEAQALDFYQTGVMPFNALCDLTGQDAIAVFNINFGRYLYDTLLAFDPKKFRNPQLKITHDYTAAGSEGHPARMEVRSFLFDELTPSPEGFLMSKEHYQYTCGVEGTYEYVDMPLDYVTRRYMVRGFREKYFAQQVVNEIKLSENNDKRVPYDTKVWQLLKMLHQMYPRISEYGHFALKTTARNIYASPTQDLVITGSAPATGDTFFVETDPIKMPCALDASADGSWQLTISGNDPHYCFILPLGNANDPEDWYDVTKLGSLKMRLKAGSAGSSGVVEIVTEQLRKYAA